MTKIIKKIATLLQILESRLVFKNANQDVKQKSLRVQELSPQTIHKGHSVTVKLDLEKPKKIALVRIREEVNNNRTTPLKAAPGWLAKAIQQDLDKKQKEKLLKEKDQEEQSFAELFKHHLGNYLDINPQLEKKLLTIPSTRFNLQTLNYWKKLFKLGDFVKPFQDDLKNLFNKYLAKEKLTNAEIVSLNAQLVILKQKYNINK